MVYVVLIPDVWFWSEWHVNECTFEPQQTRIPLSPVIYDCMDI